MNYQLSEEHLSSPTLTDVEILDCADKSHDSPINITPPKHSLWRNAGTSFATTLLFSCMTSQALADLPPSFVEQSASQTSIQASLVSDIFHENIDDLLLEENFAFFLSEQLDAQKDLIVKADEKQLDRIAKLIEGVEVD